MKRFLFFFCCIAAFLHGTEMGRFSEVSGNFWVATDFWTCSFLEGSMFPGDFTFKDGSTPGNIIFDTVVTDAEGKAYRLLEERWAETKIIRNDENSLVLERSGCFWRNVSPLISCLGGVEVVCRYEFGRKSPSLTMKYTFRKKEELSCVINRCFAMSWYFEQPFNTILYKGSREAFSLRDNERYRNWDAPDELVIEGKGFKVSMRARRVIASLRKADALYPCSLDGGLWQFHWNKGGTILECEACLTIEAARN